MDDFLELATGLPIERVEAAATLLREGERTGTIYVLLEGALRVEKAGVVVASVTEAGACVGEMSALLDLPHTADVLATQPSVVARLDDASERLAGDAELALGLARLLASRLQLVTTYLADLKQQYADEDSHLGMVDTVLSQLVRHSGRRSELGSERDPDPEY